jgi:hypothetical protein
MDSRHFKNQGMNWIRKEKRLAIYLRDGLACAYCGETLEDGSQLTLDHVRAHSRRGNNDPANLVTACYRCNSARGNRNYRRFAGYVAKYINHGVLASTIIAFVDKTRLRSIDVNAAKKIMARRGGYMQALKSLSR